MRWHDAILVVLIFFLGLVAACPTRINPDLPPEGGDDDAPAPTDADDDINPCRPSQQWCDNACVPINDELNCGACGVECEEDPCQCTNRNSDDVFACWRQLTEDTWESCEL